MARLSKRKLWEKLEAEEELSEEEWHVLFEGSEALAPHRRPSGSSQFTLRLPSPLFYEISVRARSEGKPTGQLMRELMEHGLALRAESTPVLAARVLARLLERMPEDVKRAAQASDETAPERRSAG